MPEQESKNKERKNGKAEAKSAEDYFRDFPNKLDGSRVIEKIKVDNTRHCLIHIRQTHPTGKLETREEIEEDSREVMQNVRDTHASIHMILAHMQRLYPQFKLYIEGIPRGMEKEFITKAQQQKKNDQRLRFIERKVEESQTRIEETDAMLKKIKKSEPDNLMLIRNLEDEMTLLVSQLGLALSRERGLLSDKRETDTLLLSARDFIVSGKIELRGAEDRAAFLAAIEAFDNGLKDTRVVQEKREDGLLEIISKDDIAFAVAMYGAAHDWRDTIDRWNSSHPDQKFSLIEITPGGYK